MDQNKLFIGGLPWSMTNDTLKALFAPYGEISDAVVIFDRDMGRSKGFGFVTFVNAQDAQKALEMDGRDIDGRKLVVNVARPREERPGTGGGFRRNTRRSY